MHLDLSWLLPLIEEMPAYQRLVAEMAGHNIRVAVLDAAKPYLIAALYHRFRLPMLVVTAQPEKSKRLYGQLLSWVVTTSQVRVFPEPDALPYQRVASDTMAELERVGVLSALVGIEGEQKMIRPPLVVVSAPALMAKTTLYRDFTSTSHTVRVGMEIEPLELLNQWQAMGYRLESLVEVPGTMSHRGGIIDIYPPTSDRPTRLEFFGNTVDSIRLFDPLNQCSLTSVPSIAITPATERLTSPSDSLFSYLSPSGWLVLDEPESIRAAVETLHDQADELHSQLVGRGELEPDCPRPYFTWPELETEMKKRHCLMLAAFGVSDTKLPCLDFAPAPNYAGQLAKFIEKSKQMAKQKYRLIIVSHQASRLSELLAEEGVFAPPLTEVKKTPPLGSVSLVQGSLAGGWVMANNTYLFSDAEIFGFVKQPRLWKKRAVPYHKLSISLAAGDYVVHVEHGIAKFAGVTTMSANGSEKEYLVLHYAGGDRLYVPADQIDRISRYIGSQKPLLSRLGTQEWTRTKQKVRESVADIAQELLALYAAREVISGFGFSPDTVWQQELEASFPYVETPDQIAVQAQVKEDMAESKPMDRLVCGDVGYGKTEVAIRAAFKAVMDGKQVAVLVPTTVLAEQHLATFSQRLNAFPVRVEALSRFKTTKEQEAILDGLTNGSVDICIGTHRLLQKDIAFKDLGLLIIDEEQRFGVVHKEYLKKMRREVDVLTLSATPIPRTLHMSLVGVRDMSTMETPPEERLPVRTFVAEYNERLIRDAILRERERDGQVFFVHNRVQSIAYVARKLQSLVPEAKIAIAHGQLPEAELEEVMADFTQGKSDILVCTTIIESGLDMPNVNTLIVNRADRFGLPQLYQLRGRVGRGGNLGYAYFFYDKRRQLTPTAERRLRTILEATELGAGFNIAMRDLEIRGAGTLLGTRQSGYISAVGFNLYCRLLSEAVEEAKQAGVAKEKRQPKRLPTPTIDLPLKAYIPEDYVFDINTRLSLYQDLVKVDKVEPIEDLAKEFGDRFGRPPPEVKNLLYAVKIKALAARSGIESVATEHGQIIIRLFEGMQFNEKQRQLTLPDGVRMTQSQLRLNLKRLGEEWRPVL
ncbi:MAG: transcription-repair coupling factor, partial [Dehalococcoidia bacterium]